MVCGAAAIEILIERMSDYGRVAKIAAGVAGISFLGYCIYFDRQRRSDPLFKQKLKESKFLGSYLRMGTFHQLRHYIPDQRHL